MTWVYCWLTMHCQLHLYLLCLDGIDMSSLGQYEKYALTIFRSLVDLKQMRRNRICSIYLTRICSLPETDLLNSRQFHLCFWLSGTLGRNDDKLFKFVYIFLFQWLAFLSLSLSLFFNSERWWWCREQLKGHELWFFLHRLEFFCRKLWFVHHLGHNSAQHTNT